VGSRIGVFTALSFSTFSIFIDDYVNSVNVIIRNEENFF